MKPNKNVHFEMANLLGGWVILEVIQTNGSTSDLRLVTDTSQ
jgi:hypothetical protein